MVLHGTSVYSIYQRKTDTEYKINAFYGTFKTIALHCVRTEQSTTSPPDLHSRASQNLFCNLVHFTDVSKQLTKNIGTSDPKLVQKKVLNFGLTKVITKMSIFHFFFFKKTLTWQALNCPGL